MRRREFVTLAGGAALGWPLAARAQQRMLPVIGFLHAGSPGQLAPYMTEFRRALAEAGYVEGKTVAYEFRYAEGRYERLPELAADLVRRHAAVIVTGPNQNAARAVKAATVRIPIVFLIDDDPLKFGLVDSLNHPGGNATGVNFFNNELATKRLGLIRELLPAAGRFDALVNPEAATAETFTTDVTAAATTLSAKVEIVHARDRAGIDSAFATFAHDKAEAVLVAADALFANQRAQIVGLAARYAIPVIYTVRAYVEVGGLMSYGPSVPRAYGQLAAYAARILKGEPPADLPVVQVNKFDLVINLSTARLLGLTVPPSLLAIADEVIE